MSQFTPEQWANAGEHLCKVYAAEYGREPSADEIAEARSVASHIACGTPLSRQESTR
ncbi:hypothetical protein [Novilysobacter erysipheiresistens]|uniref:Uncharacterized protein n=1 Tax=Novilysobacter erysipheiresistens TaxID=1749332 RepID=A0ABU7YUL3_9GAMM